MRFCICRGLGSLTLLIILLLAIPSPAGEKKRYPNMNVAVAVLQDARAELMEAKHDFGGQRDKSLAAADAASKNLRSALLSVSDYNPLTFYAEYVDELRKKYPRHPRIHHAIDALKQAHIELKEAKQDFGGHRDVAMRDTNAAIQQLEAALKQVKK